jgi:hypothetical protein
MLRVKRDVARLALDVSHFKSTRTWDDGQLKRAVAEAMSWDDVFTSLGLRTPKKETRTRVQGHAIRLGLDLEHLNISAKRDSSSEWRLDPMRCRVIAGRVALMLRTYKQYIVGNAAGSFGASTDAARAMVVVSESA